MGYDYINDTFGEVVKTSPKYRGVEDDAIELLSRISKNSISCDEIFEGFESVRKRMAGLKNHTIEPGYPLWLSEFLAFHFLKWRDWYMLQKIYTEQPEKFNTEALQMYHKIEQMGHNESFFETCKFCLKRLKHKKKRRVNNCQIDVKAKINQFAARLLDIIKQNH